MDSFPKLVYKNPDFQNRRPEEPTPEQLEKSRKVADDKLWKIMDPKFKDFSVRYVNIEEYREPLEKGDFGGWGNKEVTMHGAQYSGFRIPGGLEESFIEFIKHPDRSGDYSDWTVGGHLKRIAYRLMREVRQTARSHIGAERTEKLEAVRQEIIGFINQQKGDTFQPEALADVYERNSAEIEGQMDFLNPEQMERVRERYFAEGIDGVDTLEKELSLTQKQTETVFAYMLSLQSDLRRGADHVAILRRLRDDPAYIQQKGALREILTALVYSTDRKVQVEREQVPYQIGLIFDNKTFGFKSDPGWMRYRHWGSFYDSRDEWQNLTKAEQERGLLAAISIMPLKDLYQEMIALERGLGDFAHPIFDNRGLQRWPKES